MSDAVLIVKKPGSIPFIKRPSGSMKTLIKEAKARYGPCCEMFVSWIDSHGAIQVEPVDDILNGHSAMPEV